MRMRFQDILEEFEDLEDSVLLAELEEETNPEKEFQVYRLFPEGLTPEEVGERLRWCDSDGNPWGDSIIEHTVLGGSLQDVYVLACDQNLFSYGLILERGTAQMFGESEG